MIYTNILVVVTPPSIYYSCSTQNTFWEEKFTSEDNFTFGDFSVVNIKNCDCQNVRKHKEIKVSDKYVTLDTSLKCDSLEKMNITSSY